MGFFVGERAGERVGECVGERIGGREVVEGDVACGVVGGFEVTGGEVAGGMVGGDEVAGGGCRSAGGGSAPPLAGRMPFSSTIRVTSHGTRPSGTREAVLTPTSRVCPGAMRSKEVVA